MGEQPRKSPPVRIKSAVNGVDGKRDDYSNGGIYADAVWDWQSAGSDIDECDQDSF